MSVLSPLARTWPRLHLSKGWIGVGGAPDVVAFMCLAGGIRLLLLTAQSGWLDEKMDQGSEWSALGLTLTDRHSFAKITLSRYTRRSTSITKQASPQR